MKKNILLYCVQVLAIVGLCICGTFDSAVLQAEELEVKDSSDKVVEQGRYHGRMRAKGVSHSEIVHRLDSILHLGKKMKYDSITGNVNLCGVVFHVNVYDGRMNLMTSVQPESRQMRKLVKAIAKNYGEPEIDEEEMVYLWASFLHQEGERNIPYIRIRRVHGDIGGTVMFLE